MIFFNINTEKFVNDLLGVKFKKPSMRNWLYALTTPIQQYMDDYDAWRKQQYYQINITSQVFSLEGYLNDLFDAQNRTIYIGNANSIMDGAWIALEQETVPFLELGLESENIGQFMTLENEPGLNYSFVVYIPISLISQVDLIKSAVNKYRLAGKQFLIETF